MPTLTCPMPETINPLLGNSFVFSVTKYPEITFFVQRTELPSINLGVAEQFTSVHDLKLPGETLVFDALNLTFIIDEKFKSFKAISDWMVALGYPINHQMYRDLLNSPRNASSYTELSKNCSDATLHILDSGNKPIVEVAFADCFPTSLSGIELSTTNSDSNGLTASLTLEYSYYTIKTIYD